MYEECLERLAVVSRSVQNSDRAALLLPNRFDRRLLAWTFLALEVRLLTLSVRWVRPLSGGSIRCTHFLCLILLNQSVASLGHAGARCFIRRSSIKTGVAKCHVSLALLQQRWVIRYSSTVCSDPGHFRSRLRCYATGKHIENGDRAKDNSVAQCGAMLD